MNIETLLKNLAKKRPVFHSEADFQHALAWEIKLAHPDAELRLEIRPFGIEERVYLDLMVIHQDFKYAIELKYKTKKIETTYLGEKFTLINQEANDQARYDFIKDIERIEKIQMSQNCQGWAILLTNDPKFWQQNNKSKSLDRLFKIHEGEILQGTLTWASHASEGSIRGRENPLSLAGKYQMQWNDYSYIDNCKYGQFRYLALKIQ